MSRQGNEKSPNLAIIVAGGTGTRMGTATPKQLLPLGNTTVLSHVLRVFDRTAEIDTIVCVLEPSLCARIEEIGITKIHFPKLSAVIPGGETRTQSVWHGLQSIEGEALVLVHDGARPLVTSALICKAITAGRKYGAAVPAIECVDTLKIITDDGWINKTVPRDYYRRIQTPQAFNLNLLRDAYKSCIRSSFQATDDASIVEWFGHPVHIFEGDQKNIKITYSHDLLVAEYYYNKKG